MLMENSLVRVQFEDTYYDGEDDKYLCYGFEVTLLETEDVFSISYDRAEHQIGSICLENQDTSKSESISSISRKTTMELYKEFDKYSYLVKCMCRSIIEFL